MSFHHVHRAYGCATAYPEALSGAYMLDLGSGCGRDCFVLSQIVGEHGKVVGLDMTDELVSLVLIYSFVSFIFSSFDNVSFFNC